MRDGRGRKTQLNATLFICLCLLAFAVNATEAEDTGPGGNLVASGIPPLPADLVNHASRYTEVRAASFVGWHPTQREMLVSTRLGATTQIYRVAAPGGERVQLTAYPDQVANASFPPHNPGYFLFSKDTGGNEFHQTYRRDLASGATALLTDGKSRNSLGVWSQHDDHIAYASTRRNGRDTDIYVMDPLHPETDHMAAQLEGGGWSADCWSPDGRTLVLQEYRSVNESYLWILDLGSGRKTRITPTTAHAATGAKRAEPGATQSAHPGAQPNPSTRNAPAAESVSWLRARYAPDGKGLYVLTDLDNEFRRLAYIDLATGRTTFLSASIPWDVVEYDLSRDGKHIVFVTNEDGVSRLRLLQVSHPVDEQAPSAVELPPLPIGVISTVALRPDGKEIAFSFNSARATNDAYTIDIRTKKLERWTYSETAGLNTAEFPEPELVHWDSFDGRTISGFLYRPPARFTGRRPVVINIHGGPESQSLPRFLGPANYYLNELGVAILFPNVRGSTGYGKSFLKLDNGFLREDSYLDIGALLDWLPRQPGLDSTRVMVTGGSYGGHMTLATATRYPDRLRCALDIVGMSNLVTFLERTESYRRDLRRAEYGDERNPKMRAYLESIAPLNHVDKITIPLFVVQGKNDPRVPYTEAEQIVAAVRKTGAPVWYLLANDEGHGFVKKINTDYLFYSTIAFMRKHLLAE